MIFFVLTIFCVCKIMNLFESLFYYSRHDDDNEDLKNPDNECYCMENEGGSDNFRCLPSGKSKKNEKKILGFFPLILENYDNI